MGLMFLVHRDLSNYKLLLKEEHCMVEGEKVTLGSAELGDIVVTPEVIEVIIGIAASKVEGVYGMRGTFANGIAELLGHEAHGKGIYLTDNEDGSLSADVYTYLDYGVTVPKVAVEIQEAIKQQVFYMTGLDLKDINIHVVSIVPEKLTKVDTSDLFDEKKEG
jgi:uncharacterized alkaline shock family protein YloU